jgi:WhiB family transcriptional regulator, redox-sensing transcriptional regulator
VSYTERPASPSLGFDQSLPPVNGWSIDVHDDQAPFPDSEAARDLFIVDGPPQYIFEDYSKCFAVTSEPNLHLRVFNVILEKIVHPVAEETITPLDIWRMITRAQATIPKVRAAVGEIREAGLLEDTGGKRRVHQFRSKPESVLRVPADVRVIYIPEGTVVPEQPRQAKKKRSPVIPSELIIQTSVIPESNPKFAKDAACAGTDYKVFHPGRGQSTAPAKAICADCPNRLGCMEYAIATNEDEGIWGGTSGRERREIKRLRALARTAADTTSLFAL